ncbi:hypothetical protein Clacol_010265 [Clathrus columnatus]|uniref:Glycosyl hydrolase family 13 catalytic domain-containing protein n=1 Tax=Clathrus columnatus TaxID=1419009 RepID=A0AAV5AT94_9AGAM|nr:hypothetical protein Clacol_010265 [Clathrus columnatus]
MGSYVPPGVRFVPSFLCSRPRVHEFIREMYERVLTNQQLHSALTSKSFTLPVFKEVIARWQTYMQTHNGWSTVFLENHDMARSVSRYLPLKPDSPTELEARGAKLLAMLCCTLSGTIFVYQGQEIGMSSVPTTWGIDMFRDVACLNHYKEYVSENFLIHHTFRSFLRILQKRTTTLNPHPDMSDILVDICKKSRDNARTPVQWSSEKYAGFIPTSENDIQPWIPVNPNYPTCNVEQQHNDTNSVLYFWKNLIKLRKEHETLIEDQNIEYVSEDQESEGKSGIDDTQRMADYLLSNLSLDKSESIDLRSFRIRLLPLEGRVYVSSRRMNATSRPKTTSLMAALEKLGFGPCHHMRTVVKNGDPNEPRTLQKIGQGIGSLEDIHTIFDSYGSILDYPAVCYFEELYKAYPDAKYILTTRDPAQWESSMRSTIFKAVKEYENATNRTPFFDALTDWFCTEMIGRYHRGRLYADPQGELLAHNERVKTMIPVDKLLVYQVSEGWEPLVKFLGV